MKKKPKSSNDVAAMMNQIQGQLAVLDSKLDSFMTKSLKELAEALAASKPTQRGQSPFGDSPRQHLQAPARISSQEHTSRRPMFAVVCYACGMDTELPFKPSGNRPVYCRECFAKRKNQRGQSPSGDSPLKSVLPSVATDSSVNAQKPSASAPAVKAKVKRSTGKPAKAKTKAKPKAAKKKKAAGRK